MAKLLPKAPGTVRLLAAADVHLGRVLPLPRVIKNSFLTTEAAWESLIDLVLDPEEGVDALLLAGDLFDKEENILEAPFFFEKGMKRLAKAEKPVVAIAGNHDWRSLRRRHRLMGFPQLHVLGLNDAWEHCDLDFGSQRVRFEGWSFPSSQYRKNPLDFLPPMESGLTTIGLLHGDWEGKSESPYAPFTVKELIESGRKAWVLGHIHIPKILSQNPYVISCGSLQGLDSSEQGERGAFLIDINANGGLHVEMVPLAAVLWQTLSVDITGVRAEEYEAFLQKALEKQKSLRASLKCLVLEAVWKGRINDNHAKETLKKIEGSYFTLQKQNGFIDCYIRRSKIEVQPVIDLPLLAQEQSLVGLVARQMLQMEEEGERKRLEEILAKEAGCYPHFSLDFAIEDLKSEGYGILFDLLEQRGTK